jgi:hypothetical protein
MSTKFGLAGSGVLEVKKNMIFHFGTEIQDGCMSFFSINTIY